MLLILLLNTFLSFLQDMLVSLSTLLRGTTYEKLRWTFTLYDLNKDGYITKQEVTNVVLAVHELMGIHGSPQVQLHLIFFQFYKAFVIVFVIGLHK